MRLTDPRFCAPFLGLLALGASLEQAPYRLAGSDAGALLTAAARILRGGVFYRDIDSYPFPGAAYLLAGVMHVFGEHVAVARALAAILFCVTVIALYRAAVRLVGPSRAATFGLLLLAFKFIAWPSFTAYYYWDVALCFGCVSIALFLGHSFRGPSLRLALAGLFAGLAITAKQSLGLPLAAAGGAVLLFAGSVAGVRREADTSRFGELAAFGAGAALPVLGLAGYFASQGLLGAMVESGLLRPFSAYLPTSSTSFLEPLAWWQLGTLQELAGLAYSNEPFWTLLTQRQMPGEALYPFFWTLNEVFSRSLYTSVPIAFAAALWLRLRARAAPPSGERLALFVFTPLAAAVFLSAFPRADFTHVISVYPVVLLLIFALVGARFARGERIAAAFVVTACVALTAVQQSQLTHRLQLERADLWISPQKRWIEATARFVGESIPAGEPFFVYGHEAYYYFLSDRYSQWRFSQLYAGQAGGDGGRAIAAILNADPPRWIVRGAIRFPRVTPIPKYAPRLDQWIRRHYEEIPTALREHLPTDAERPLPRQLMLLRRRAN